ncbi:MAG: GntR family transcriptional regulator [Lachnospiraceae bacterium]|jgi:DNA-binding GntR family transcriptional regulator
MTNDFQIQMDEYLPLRDVVFRTLRQAILRGELKPGERLMEIALANKLGVSRTPIREAIRKLELEGLVIMIPRRGAQVASITERDLNEVLEVRQGLEALAIRFACDRITQEQLYALKKAKEKFEKLQEKGNLMELTEADVEFHEVIYQATHNQRMVQMLNNLREQMYRYRMEYLKDPKVTHDLIAEHEGIYQALKKRDKELAVACVSRHIENQQQGIIQSLWGKE